MFHFAWISDQGAHRYDRLVVQSCLPVIHSTFSTLLELALGPSGKWSTKCICVDVFVECNIYLRYTGLLPQHEMEVSKRSIHG